MTEKIGVVGIGHAKFGKRTDATIRELAHEAVKPALEDAGLTTADIDAAVIVTESGYVYRGVDLLEYTETYGHIAGHRDRLAHER